MGAVSIDDFNHNPDVAGRVKGVTSLFNGLGRRGRGQPVKQHICYIEIRDTGPITALAAPLMV